MSYRLLILTLLLALTGATGWASDSGPEALFQQGRASYESEDYGQAAALYDQLLAQGYGTPEVHFNLGNALFRLGQAGRAVGHYRRAQYLEPRDPDIRANLAIVQQQVGALPTETTPWEQLAGHLSRTEWRALMLAGYWLAAGLGILYLLAGRKAWLLRGVGLSLLLMVISSSGWWYWRELEARPEAVVIQGNAQALFAPLESAMPHFTLPEGSVVRVQEQSGRWLKIQAGRQEGWVATVTCERLSQHP